VRSRKSTDLNADIEQGHLSSALCHLGNISYRLGELMSPAACLEKMESISTTENVKQTMERVLAHLKANNVDTMQNKVRTGDYLALDPKTETFTASQSANDMLSREYRAPFVVPAAGQV
ncbi:MAG: gfo/Idh/MocA family oxidoreductase, partial [Planctomycetales bacterium]|nr:gfo/Idh/MocA family oxidoreductase [Planctomycetales bacterium]